MLIEKIIERLQELINNKNTEIDKIQLDLLESLNKEIMDARGRLNTAYGYLISQMRDLLSEIDHDKKNHLLLDQLQILNNELTARIKTINKNQQNMHKLVLQHIYHLTIFPEMIQSITFNLSNFTKNRVLLREQEKQLDYHSRQIEATKDEWEIVRSLLSYLETLPIQTEYFGCRYFREILKDKGYEINFKKQKIAYQWKKNQYLVQDNYKKYTDNFRVNHCFSFLVIPDLVSIYTMLRKYIPSEEFLGHVKNTSSQIELKPIEMWSSTLIGLSSKDNAAGDFSRGVTIEGQSIGNTKEELDQRIQEFIGQSKYNDTDRSLFIDWFKRNAGQDMIRFIDPLADGGYLIQGNWDLSSSKNLFQNWYINNNSIFFECGISVYILNKDAYKFVFRDSTGKLNQIDGDCLSGHEREEAIGSMYQEMKELRLLPLVTIMAVTQLEIEEVAELSIKIHETLEIENTSEVLKRVISPNMKMLHLAWYTNELSDQSRLKLKNDFQNNAEKSSFIVHRAK
ncbi:MAG: hypothetical protein A3F12_06840 [Gammaproteobacteria bacterium RIFCSPHIGHO2_12_FULL_38_14]|nr:MAG: hypothetical protein A3F12_06840 [Gammaproteobacteria bacterium RIFCSPHIGHO2_12_FULL_38_14]